MTKSGRCKASRSDRMSHLSSGSSQVPPNPFTFTMAPSDRVTMETAGGQTLVARRQSSHKLPRLRIPRPHDEFDLVEDSWVDDEDVEEAGKQLFSNFVRDRVAVEDPEAARDLQILTPAGYANPMWAKAGRELRHMADVFAETAERRRVKQKAEQVSVNITYEDFKDLLAELFASGGITKERIVVLFYFCSDIAIRAVRRGADLCKQFLRWSFSFIADSVCSWVRSHGGWGEVMGSSFSSLSHVLFLAGVIFIGYGVMKYINRS